MIERAVSVPQPPRQETQQEWDQVSEARGIRYRSTGSGPVVLFLHGLGGAAREFERQLRHFGQRFRAVAWDMPGIGGSVPLPVATMDALAAALAGFIQAADLGRPVLVGHGLGGMVALHLAAKAGQAARALALCQARAEFGAQDEAGAAAFMAARLGALDAGRDMGAFAREFVAGMVADGADADGVALAVACMAATPAGAYRDGALAMTGFDQRDALGRIEAPTLVLSGERDGGFSAKGAETLAAGIPGAARAVVEGAGHWAHLERPARFNAALEAFLNGLEPPARSGEQP